MGSDLGSEPMGAAPEGSGVSQGLESSRGALGFAGSQGPALQTDGLRGIW